MLISFGLLEARPMPFVRGASEGYVRVANPLAENEAYLRRDLLDSLARRAEHNLAHMQREVRLFEVGSVFVLWEIVVDGDVRGEVRRVALDTPVWAAPPLGVELLLMPVESAMVAPAGS